MRLTYSGLVAQAEHLRAYATEKMQVDPLLFEGWRVEPAVFATGRGDTFTGQGYLVVHHPLNSCAVLVQDAAGWDALIASYDAMVEQLIDRDQEERAKATRPGEVSHG